jgi:hypothetical protein
VTWTSPSDVAAVVRRRWEDQALLRAYAAGDPFPTIDVPLRGPRAAEIGADLRKVQTWAASLETASRNGQRYDLTYAEVGGRLIGRNRLPARVVVSAYSQAWVILGVHAEVSRYDELLTGAIVEPTIRSWAAQQPLKALAQSTSWSQLLAAYRWLDDHRGKHRYLREISAPGVDTKFVEQHRAVLADLLGVRRSSTGFVTDLGLRGKPGTVRLRCAPGFLDLPRSVSELTFRADELAAVRVAVQTAVIVENEITYLSVPVPNEGVVIWGKGFEVDRAGRMPWLKDAEVHYWGDLDTHGFAILDRLRAWLPQTRSFLMDRDTLRSHQDRWGQEPSPSAARLTRLAPDEGALYDDLVTDRLAVRLRLEQERIDWAWASKRIPYS